jgi:adenylate cyclase class 1
VPYHRSANPAPSATANTPLYLQKAIDNSNIDSGLDRKNLTLLKKRFAHLNSTRLERIASALPERQQAFLQLLPLLFHVNHPMLPGYVSGSTPIGVAGYASVNTASSS